MEHKDFLMGYRFLRESGLSSAMSHFCLKSEEWIKENIPIVQYDPPIYQFITSTFFRMQLPYGGFVYEIDGHWQRIEIKNT